MNRKKIISFDIDGVLNDYPQCWVDYINKKMHTKFSSKTEAKKKLGSHKYNKIKHTYRLSNYKYSIPVEKKTVNLMKKLKKKFKIIIVTSRPFQKYPNMKLNTNKWLVKRKIPFDELYYKSKLIFTKYPKIFFHIDNEVNDCNFLIKKKINCFVIRKKKFEVKSKYLTIINSIDFLEKYI